MDRSISGMKIIIVKDYVAMSDYAAYAISSEINKNIKYKGKSVIVFSAGDTPKLTYGILKKNYNRNIDGGKIILFQMDEYCGLPPNNPQSFAYYLMENIIKPLSIKEYYFINNEYGNITISCADYERKLNNENGIDIIVHGIGENGHLGFNEPGSSFESRTRIVNLAENTIVANSRFFKSINDVPKKGITMGLKTIFEAQKTFLLASGNKKNTAIRNALLGKITERVPATILRNHPDVEVILDKEAWGY